LATPLINQLDATLTVGLYVYVRLLHLDYATMRPMSIKWKVCTNIIPALFACCFSALQPLILDTAWGLPGSTLPYY